VHRFVEATKAWSSEGITRCNKAMQEASTFQKMDKFLSEPTARSKNSV